VRRIDSVKRVRRPTPGIPNDLALRLFAAFVFLCPTFAHALDLPEGKVSLVLSGYSYHFNIRPGVKAESLNQRNYGLGLEFDHRKPAGATFRYVNNFGWYKDSLNSTAHYVGGAVFYDWLGDHRLRLSLGAELSGFYSERYNQGRPFLALLPVANIGSESASVNLVVVPRVPQFIDAGVVFVQFKIKIK